jgi:hypothetical protein
LGFLVFWPHFSLTGVWLALVRIHRNKRQKWRLSYTQNLTRNIRLNPNRIIYIYECVGPVHRLMIHTNLTEWLAQQYQKARHSRH